MRWAFDSGIRRHPANTLQKLGRRFAHVNGVVSQQPRCISRQVATLGFVDNHGSSVRYAQEVAPEIWRTVDINTVRTALIVRSAVCLGSVLFVGVSRSVNLVFGVVGTSAELQQIHRSPNS